ncbi:GIY-YIG nuclease family protein [Thermofilum pendens]|nr:GIY-YIG nuclease family protein [Thermofilum pendens]
MMPADNVAPSGKGIYILLIVLKSDAKLSSISGKEVTLRAGIYLYLGSAKGPGGLRARVSRHLRREKRVHWHIDRLLAAPGASVAYVVYGETHLPECVLTRPLEELGCRHPLPGFGSSDCKHGCTSHLLECGGGEKDCLEKAVEAFRRNGVTPGVLHVS